MPPLNLASRLAMFPLILLVLMVLVLQGCSSDSAPALTPEPGPDANPVGYYENAGTASVNGGTLLIDDLQAMVHGNRIMMMSAKEELLYDGTITDITEDEFTADFTIYYQGSKPTESSATVTGQIIEGLSISGTLNGSGFGEGTFSLLYASTNSEEAAISRVENGIGKAEWEGPIGSSGASFQLRVVIDNTGVITSTRTAVGGALTSCDFTGTITPIGGTSLHSINVSLSDCIGGNADGDYTGFAASRTQTNADDRLVFAVSDGRYSPNTDFILID